MWQMRFGAVLRERLRQEPTAAVLVSRSGTNLHWLGQRYSHAGVALRDMVLQFGDEADGALREHTLVLKPYLQDGSLHWQCGEAAMGADAQALSETDAQNA